MMDDIVTVDGAVVRGGGQVLRNSAAYAAILGKSIQFVNIRVSRRKPGLRPQYIEGLQVVANLSKCTLNNAYEGSQSVFFIPEENFIPSSSDLSSSTLSTSSTSSACYEVHTMDAATSLLLQASLPVLLFSPTVTNLVLSGGADMVVSPAIDYVKLILVPLLLRHFRVTVDVEIVRRDYMPRGAAMVNIRTSPTESLPPICMRDRGNVVKVSSILYGYGKGDNHHKKFVEAAETSLHEALRENGIINMDVSFSTDIQGSETDEPLVCGALIYAETSAGCILGGSSSSSNVLSTEDLMPSAVVDLVKQLGHGGCTDEYLQDQLVIFMALADGVSEIVTGPITEHTESALAIAQRMTDAKFSVTPVVGNSGQFEIRCEGIGHQSRQQRCPTPNSSPMFGLSTCSQHHFGDMFHPMNAT